MSVKQYSGGGRRPTGRTEHMQIRLSPEEKAAFEQAAEQYGLSLSDWARMNLRAASMPQQPKGPGSSLHGLAGD